MTKKDENINKCVNFINEFKEIFLDKDIKNLASFSFLNLSDNEKYHDNDIKNI